MVIYIIIALYTTVDQLTDDLYKSLFTYVHCVHFRYVLAAPPPRMKSHVFTKIQNNPKSAIPT